MCDSFCMGKCRDHPKSVAYVSLHVLPLFDLTVANIVSWHRSDARLRYRRCRSPEGYRLSAFKIDLIPRWVVALILFIAFLRPMPQVSLNHFGEIFFLSPESRLRTVGSLGRVTRLVLLIACVNVWGIRVLDMSCKALVDAELIS